MASSLLQSRELPQDATKAAALSTGELADHGRAHSPTPNHSPVVISASPSKVSLSDPKKPGASHVNLDFFDPDGIRILERTMSQISEAQNGDKENGGSLSSDDTLTTNGPFDFEKMLRAMAQK
jgi:ATP-binding cassette subfamily G (WHITE) protein 2 (SNQ2)